MNQQDFVQAGFTVIDGSDTSNPLLSYLKQHYPSVIRDNEINLNELKSILGLPINDKVNGYGLNFIGRSFARAKYSQETDKAVSLNIAMSKGIDTTQNLVLKGDNLDSLKLLMNCYRGQIKCIYIDPPYNTTKDNFTYPDKFNKEETEVLGLVNLSDDDFERMEFSFKTKKSHNGWLAFMYPRLLLARDLLKNDGVILISIDENEHSQLKLLCDEIFGDENFAGEIIWKNSSKNDESYISMQHEYILVYVKSKIQNLGQWSELKVGLDKIYKAFEGFKKQHGNNWEKIHEEALEWFNQFPDSDPITNSKHYSWMDEEGVYFPDNISKPENGYYYEIIHPVTKQPCKKPSGGWRFIEKTMKDKIKENKIHFGKDHTVVPNNKTYLKNTEFQSLTSLTFKDGRVASNWLKKLFGVKDVFTNPKDYNVLANIFKAMGIQENDIVLDFFAGSGSTAEAIMRLNAEDKGNRKFILCQIDEPIDAQKKKNSHKFCIDNNLTPVISSITIERLNRAGEAIKAEIEKHNAKKNLAESDKKQLPDIGYKVFDSVPAPKLAVDGKGQIAFPELHSDVISRIYNMIFKVGIDEPSQVPTPVIPDCMYQLGDNYYITDSHKVSEEMLLNALKSGTVYIDGWTASLDVTLQSQKDKVKIVF